MKKSAGILLHISSLNNDSIGTLGIEAYKFVDFLEKSKQHLWQVLPLNPVGPGNSPYMSTCSEAIETRYICLDLLVKQGLLKRVPKFQSKTNFIHYNDVEQFKEKYLWQAFQNFKKTSMHRAAACATW